MSRYVRVSELVVQLCVDDAFLSALEAEDLIHLKRTAEEELVISAEDAERVRVAHLLADELDVNLPGVEVIMHMRDAMLAMQRQFSEIIEAIAEEIRRREKA